MKTIKHGQQVIGEENDVQMKLLDETEKEVEKTTAQIVLVDSKIKSLLQKSKTCCLWVVIIIELVIVGLLVWALV